VRQVSTRAIDTPARGACPAAPARRASIAVAGVARGIHGTAATSRQHSLSASVSTWGTTRARKVHTMATATDPVDAVSDAEHEANMKRKEEAGNQGNSDEWKWTLNWDPITSNIIVGSCPRSAADLDRLVNEAGIEAIICLQSDVCFEALKIDHKSIRERAIERGVILSRVAVRDFDHNDQAAMLPEAVRILGLLQETGKKTYVHCTAGINRATLTVVGYMTFLQGIPVDEAVDFVKEKRPQAHPYLDCWKTARNRLLDGRGEELKWRSQKVYEDRCFNGNGGDSSSDWEVAEQNLITETFKRRVGVDASVLRSVWEMEELQKGALLRHEEEEREQHAQQMTEMKSKLEAAEARAAEAEKLQGSLHTLVEESRRAEEAHQAEVLALGDKIQEAEGRAGAAAEEAAAALARATESERMASDAVSAAEKAAAAIADSASRAEAEARSASEMQAKASTAASAQADMAARLEEAKALAESLRKDVEAAGKGKAAAEAALAAAEERVREGKAAAEAALAAAEERVRAANEEITITMGGAQDLIQSEREEVARLREALATAEANLAEQGLFNAALDEKLMEMAREAAVTLEWRNEQILKRGRQAEY